MKAQSTLFQVFFVALQIKSALAIQTNAPEPGKKSIIKVDVIARHLSHPWGIQFLPDGRLLISEREGNLRIVTPQGEVGPPIDGTPKVTAREQGGLLDLLLAQDFKNSQTLYLTYVPSNHEEEFFTAVGRGRLVLKKNNAGNLDSFTEIFCQFPPVKTWHHFGSRLVWSREGNLYVSLGDRLIARSQAQNPKNLIGKIVLIKTDGSAAFNQPAHPDWDPRVWSIGHRNVQGAALDPESGELWTLEHGPQGGDELNRTERGKNYGWPIITYGREYTGEPIGEGTKKSGLEQPIYYWTPSIATSSLIFYTGDLFPEWKGNIFVGALNGKKIARLILLKGQVIQEESLLTELHQRIRSIAQGPDGAIWVLLDDPIDGQLVRISPAN